MTTREYAKNLFSQWSDEDFCAQPVFDKLFFQVLNGQRAVNAAGIQPINFTRWRKAMRDGDQLPTAGDLQAALVRMERRGYVFTDEDTGEVLIRSRIRRDELDKQPTMFLAALRILVVIDSPKFAAVLAGELDRMEVPEVKGEKDYAKRLRDSLTHTYVAAREHLKTLADGFEHPFPEPFEELTTGPSRGPSTRPSPGGSLGPSPRPGETGPSVGPSPGPTKGPSGSGSGSGSLTLVSTHLGGTRAQARDADTAPHGSGDEPPSDPQDPEPARRCKKHAANPDAEFDENCGPCANFRKAHARWQIRDRRRQHAAQSETAHAAAALRAEAIEACELCDKHGYVHGHPTRVCDHHDRTETNARGMAALRAEMGWTETEPADTQPCEESTDA